MKSCSTPAWEVKDLNLYWRVALCLAGSRDIEAADQTSSQNLVDTHGYVRQQDLVVKA
jgi:hypothetical protein